MPEIIFGILVLALLLWASNAFTYVDPRKLAPVVKFAGGFGALGGAAFLAALMALAACSSDNRKVLIVYSPHGKELLEYFEKGFEKAHPDIDVQWVDMGSQEVLERVRVVVPDPPGASFVVADPAPRRQDQSVIWEIPTVDRGVFGPLRVTYRVAGSVASHAWIEFRHRRPHGCSEGAVGDGRRRQRRGEPMPAGAGNIRQSTCPSRGIGCRTGGEVAEQCAVQCAPRTGRRNLLRC